MMKYGLKMEIFVISGADMKCVTDARTLSV